MQWTTALSDEADTERAIEVALERVTTALDAPPDLILVFLGAAHQVDPVIAAIHLATPEALVVGCSAGGVAGGGLELEHGGGLVLCAGHLPGVRLHGFHLQPSRVPRVADPEAWREALGVQGEDLGEMRGLLLLPDPFSFPSEGAFAGLDAAFPGVPIFGGLASGADEPGSHALILGERQFPSGAVGVCMSGDVAIDTLVAQGCRPVGQPMFITDCQRNVIHRLDDQEPEDVLQQLFASLNPDDQQIMQTGLFLGLGMSQEREVYGAGDFLIRNVLALDKETGGLVVGAIPRRWQIAHFHLRDARASSDDLARQLSLYASGLAAMRPSGALVFSCLGRGQRLYGRANHDTDMFRAALGDVPVGGFFCNGEIGPVHGQTFLHGYTSVFVLFRDA